MAPSTHPTSATRRFLAGAALWLCAAVVQAFGLDDVTLRARQLAAAPQPAPAAPLPAELKALNYDEYRDIRFKPSQALWRNELLPFELMFFHLGGFQTRSVLINEVNAAGEVRHVAFDRDSFDYGKNQLSPQGWGDLGFAGFRVHVALNNPAYKDELVVFLGASYFRAVGAGQRYGLSARGLAIDTVGGSGEEFPRFTEFWIEKPAPGATSLVIYALLESARATGAYRFELTPGADTVTKVQTRLFVRAGAAPIGTFGVAPLTSMFMFGENQPHRSDFRPEVHDSDGLMVATGDGEWLWRPLLNPSRPLTTSFAMRSPRGFGLMQRDRSFASYEDLEARYELRPSLWIAPQGDWGPGRVELVQLNTPDETNDNVVAYWVPERLPAPGEPLALAYEMRWQGTQQQRPPGAWVTQTRAGRGYAELQPNEQQFVVDFAGPPFAALATSNTGAAPKAVVTSNANGVITEQNAYRNDATGGWRMTLRVKQIEASRPVELRVFLQLGSDTLSETWTHVIPPQ